MRPEADNPTDETSIIAAQMGDIGQLVAWLLTIALPLARLDDAETPLGGQE